MLECGVACVCGEPKLQALVYDILPSITAVFSYAIGSRKLSPNEQFFAGAQTVVSLLQTTQIKQGVSFIEANKIYTSTNKLNLAEFGGRCRKAMLGVWGHSLSSKSCPPTLSAPSERLGYK